MCRTICFLLCLILRARSQIPSKLRFHPNFDPRQQRASILRLDDFSEDKNNKTSYSYLLSLGTDDKLPNIFHNISNFDHSNPPEMKTLVSAPNYKEVIDKIEDVVSAVSERDGFISLNKQDNNSVHFPAPVKAQPRIPPPTSRPSISSAMRRTAPADIVGFSAIRASGFSRVGDSRIYFENTVTDTNYGWDSFNSIFITHYPGLYFFTFSVKADGDGENFKYEVSLIKNGEEVVSVGGAVDPSLKNVGTSASNSVILSLEKEDRVWLQLVRGGLVETVNKKTGYSSFSGYKLGCALNPDRPSDFTSVSLEDVAQSLDQESLDNLDGDRGDSNIDRNDMNYNRPANTDRYQTKKRPSYPNRYQNDNHQSLPDRYQNDNQQQYPPNRYQNDNKQSYPNRYENDNKYPNRYQNNDRPAYPDRPNIYKDKHIYDAFNYNSDSSRGQLRPSHRPFNDNGPAIIDKKYIPKPNSHQDGFNDFFADNENDRAEDDREDTRHPDNRYNNHDNNHGERYNNHAGHENRYEEDRYRDRYHVNMDRVRDDDNDRRDDLDSDASAAMFFKRRQAMNHQREIDNKTTHLSYGK